LDLSRFRTAPSVFSSYHSFQSDRNFPTQCWVASSRIVEAVDVFEERYLGLLAGVPCVLPDQFSFDGFEEGFGGGVIVTIRKQLTFHVSASPIWPAEGKEGPRPTPRNRLKLLF
jgi:hypothetical protein